MGNRINEIENARNHLAFPKKKSWLSLDPSTLSSIVQ